LALRAAGLAATLGVLALAALGPADPDANPASRLVLVVAWAGLVPLSLVAPGAWRRASPLRTLTALLARATGDPRERGVRPLPEGAGWWPAVPGLAALLVVEGPLRGVPLALLAFLVVYGLAQLAAAAVYGSGWYAHGEVFEVLAAVVGRLSPVRRDQDGRFRLARPPLTDPAPPGAEAVAGLLIGASLADFATDLPVWGRLTLGPGPAAETLLELGLLAACAGVATGLAVVAGRPRPLRPAVLPIAVGYLFAHYFALLLVEGQAAFSQLGALARGGTAALTAVQPTVRYDVLPGPLAASLQLLGFLLPHLAAVAAATVIALGRYGPRRARAATAPLLGVVLLSVLAGTALRYSAG
jgi:hypothetical protein